MSEREGVFVRYFIYVDETGTLDYKNSGGTESPYFGFGSLILPYSHTEALFQAQALRVELEQKGVHIPSKFHAKDDSWETRNEVFSLIADQSPVFDASLYFKPNAFLNVKKKGKAYLYHLCLFLHLKRVCDLRFSTEDELYIVVSTIGSAAFRKAAFYAVKDVGEQLRQKVTACFWDSESSWGLQASDYLLWAVQRNVRGKKLVQWDRDISPLVREVCFPWG